MIDTSVDSRKNIICLLPCPVLQFYRLEMVVSYSCSCFVVADLLSPPQIVCSNWDLPSFTVYPLAIVHFTLLLSQTLFKKSKSSLFFAAFWQNLARKIWHLLHKKKMLNIEGGDVTRDHFAYRVFNWKMVVKNKWKCAQNIMQFELSRGSSQILIKIKWLSIKSASRKAFYHQCQLWKVKSTVFCRCWSRSRSEFACKMRDFSSLK